MLIIPHGLPRKSRRGVETVQTCKVRLVLRRKKVQSIDLKSEKVLLKPKNTKMHWVCIFLCTDCSHLSLQEEKGMGVTGKQQRPFPCAWKVGWESPQRHLNISCYIEHNALIVLLFAFHYLKDSTNPRVCWSCWTDPAREGGTGEGGSLAAFLCAQAGMATLTTAQCISWHHKHSFQQPCLTLFSAEEQNTNPQVQSKGTNLLQSPTHSQGSPLGAALRAGQQLSKGNFSMPFSLESTVNPFNPS